MLDAGVISLYFAEREDVKTFLIGFSKVPLKVIFVRLILPNTTIRLLER